MYLVKIHVCFFHMKTFFLLAVSLIMGCSLKQQNNSHGEDRPNWAMVPFVKVDSLNPILYAGNGVFTCPIVKSLVRWEEKDVFNPAAAVRNDSVYLIYRAEDNIGRYAGTSRLGLAVSADGLHFNRRLTPILFPAEDFMKTYEWEGGIEDPRIVEREDGLYVMTYTAYDGKTARLCVASSPDLLTWTKHGLVLAGSFRDAWSKSGAIVAKQVGSKIVAQKINEKYWMYFGDSDLFMATSDDLISWEPLAQNGKLKSVLRPRSGYFDSRLVESGPYALLTEKGIVLIYNGMNLDEGGDPSIAGGAYCAGQALFDAHEPTRLLDRLEKNFLMPDRPYEIAGQVNQVCFVEGLVSFRGKWLLYFGTADSKIAVATLNPAAN